MSQSQSPFERDDRPKIGELQSVIIALGGVFWALEMLSTHQVAKGTATEDERIEGVACLISAGRRLVVGVSDRF